MLKRYASGSAVTKSPDRWAAVNFRATAEDRKNYKLIMGEELTSDLLARRVQKLWQDERESMAQEAAQRPTPST